MAFVRKIEYAELLRRVRSSSPRRIVSIALLLIGVTLLGYVGSQYWDMYHSQRQLEAQWEHQQLSALPAPGQPKAAIATADLLTRVSIPRIKLDAIVVE